MSTTPALKVLVVDDSNTIRRSAEIFLKQGGHEVLLADDGFTAEEAAAWLYTVQDELGERPIDALTSGRHHRVNRIASTLAF